MIIGGHDEFIGVRKQSVIDTEDFSYFVEVIVPLVQIFISQFFTSEIQSQAP